VEKFKYLGTTLTNQNDIHDEIKSRLNSGNACYYSVQNLLSFRLISKNPKVILPFVLYGCETWSLTLREEHRLRVFENRVLRKIFGPKREVDESWRKLHSDELHSLCSSPNIRVIKSRRMCVGLIPQPRSPIKCLWIEKSIKEGQGAIGTVEAS
jgi:hypothetical protein